MRSRVHAPASYLQKRSSLTWRRDRTEIAPRSHGGVAGRSGAPPAHHVLERREHQVVLGLSRALERAGVGGLEERREQRAARRLVRRRHERLHLEVARAEGSCLGRPEASSCGHGEPPSCSGGAPGSRGSGLSRETVQGGRGGAVLGAGRTALSPTSCSTGAASRLPAAWPSHGLVVEKSENPQPWGSPEASFGGHIEPPSHGGCALGYAVAD